MKRTNRIISLILSTQLVATSVFAGPVSLQKQPNPIGGVTAPLDSKDKKNIDAKTIAKKTVLFPLKALWWVTKPQLIMLGTGIFDLSLLGGYSIYKVNKFMNENCPIVKETLRAISKFKKADGKFDVLSDTNTLRFCADMYCCAKKLDSSLDLKDSDFSGSKDVKFEDIKKAYDDCNTGYEAVREFLSHYVTFSPSVKSVLSERLPGLPGYFVLSLSGYWIFAINGGFKINNKSVKDIVGTFDAACSDVINLIVQPQPVDAGVQEIVQPQPVDAGVQERATEVQQKLNAWKETMDILLEK